MELESSMTPRREEDRVCYDPALEGTISLPAFEYCSLLDTRIEQRVSSRLL